MEMLAREIQEGAYDLHVHSTPSAFPRLQDGVEIIKEADASKMAGILLKSHYESTAVRAELINKYSNCKTRAYGSLALNWPCGGLNRYAVENALKVGAKIIWMPTRDAANSLLFGNMEHDFFSRPGITILKEDGTLKDEVYEIMDLVRAKDAVLATGHISPAESVLLCREGRARKVRMVLTHPDFPRTRIPVRMQTELAALGVVIEKNWYNITQGAIAVTEMAASIGQVGSSHTYIATDRGQEGEPSAVSEYRRFIGVLLEAGLTKTQLMDVTHSVPQSIVGEG